MAGVAFALLLALKIYVYAIIVWSFGSMMPMWRFKPWYRTLDSFVSPFVSLFYPLKLQYNNIDFTPLAAILSIEIFRYLVQYALARQAGY